MTKKHLKTLVCVLITVAILMSVFSACSGITFGGGKPNDGDLDDGDQSKVYVTFMSEGVRYKKVEIKAGASMPSNPERAGYDFRGWFLDNRTFLNEFTADNLARVTADLTVYAAWLDLNEQAIDHLIDQLEILVKFSNIMPADKDALFVEIDRLREDVWKLPTYDHRMALVYFEINEIRALLQQQINIYKVEGILDEIDIDDYRRLLDEITDATNDVLSELGEPELGDIIFESEEDPLDPQPPGLPDNGDGENGTEIIWPGEDPDKDGGTPIDYDDVWEAALRHYEARMNDPNLTPEERAAAEALFNMLKAMLEK